MSDELDIIFPIGSHIFYLGGSDDYDEAWGEIGYIVDYEETYTVSQKRGRKHISTDILLLTERGDYRMIPNKLWDGSYGIRLVCEVSGAELCRRGQRYPQDSLTHYIPHDWERVGVSGTLTLELDESLEEWRSHEYV